MQQWSAAVVICERGCLPGGGVYLGGCLPRWDVCRGGVCLVGVYLCVWGGGGREGGVSAHVGVHPLWTEFLTHTCENITFPQLLLRTVKIVSNEMNHSNCSISHERKV